MKIAILGTRGIPNRYGGFEQFAEYLSAGLCDRGHEVFVYCPHNHGYKASTLGKVHLIHQYDPESRIGTFGQFIYDLNCIIDSRSRNFDIIYQLGYTSSSIWSKFFPDDAILVTNMDGLEWRRSKYGKLTRKFLKYAEGLAVKHSNYLISDSVGIQSYLLQSYGASSEFLSYGALTFDHPDFQTLAIYGLSEYGYDMLIARLEPENNIEMILDGRVMAGISRPFIVIANYKTKYGQYLKRKYNSNTEIRFLGPNYDMTVINNMRYYSNLYFHGHSVGGTNPSLLEAMASSALIAAHHNEFNQSVLGNDAFYFSDAGQVRDILEKIAKDGKNEPMIASNIAKIRSKYSWDQIVSGYDAFFSSLISDK